MPQSLLGGRGILLEWPLEASLGEDEVGDQEADVGALNLGSTFYFKCTCV